MARPEAREKVKFHHIHRERGTHAYNPSFASSPQALQAEFGASTAQEHIHCRTTAVDLSKTKYHLLSISPVRRITTTTVVLTVR